MNILIVSGGNVDREFLNKMLKDYDKIIAVDKGLESLHELNIIPDYIVGDFDSLKKEILEQYKDIPTYSYNPEKDFTDTDLGLKIAIEQKPEKITIIGGTGTRLDHTLANIHILKTALESNISCELLDEHNKVYLIDTYKEIKKEKAFGKFISIIPLTNKVCGITLNGFKYTIENYTLEIGSSLGISNEIINDVASIDLKSGILIIIESKD